MALLLLIDTATENASVSLSLNGTVLQECISMEQKNHASFLQPAIKAILSDNNYSINQLDAVAVTNGPGSYTGLRVGLASAKGICYAINKPLITLNTLQVMAEVVYNEVENILNCTPNLPILFCPMIDARRMEVFTAAFNQAKEFVMETAAIIVNETSFEQEMKNNFVIISGNGALKFLKLTQNKHLFFCNITHSSKNMISLAEAAFNTKLFADVAYSQPYYGKEFYNIPPKV